MVPFEVLALVLWSIFGLIGRVRKFPKELGATIGFAAMLLFIRIADSRLGDLAVRALTGIGVDSDAALVKWCVYTGVILLAVYFLYAGQTFTFEGSWPPNQMIGAVIDVTIGLFNGWIAIGTWWHYTDALGYPFERWGLYVAPLSEHAQTLLKLTPQAVLPSSVSMVVIGLFLVMLLTLRVFR
jgi:hypothetical protein